MFSHQNNNPKAINKKAMFITALLVQYVIPGTMFYFMHHVESIKDCGDCNYEEWQQKYLKYYALFMIFVVTVKPLINKDVNLKKKHGIISLVGYSNYFRNNNYVLCIV